MSWSILFKTGALGQPGLIVSLFSSQYFGKIDIPVDFSNPDTLDELYESEQVKRFRELARAYPAEKCVTCERWEICGGGCFTRWLCENPTDYIK